MAIKLRNSSLRQLVLEIGLIGLVVVLLNYGSNFLITKRNVPADSIDAVLSEPTNSIDPYMQQIVKNVLSRGISSTKSESGVALVLNVDDGSIKAVKGLDASGKAVDNLATTAWEPGSVIKPLIMAAALNEGTVSPSTKYYETGLVKVKDKVFVNFFHFPPQTVSMQDVLSQSLNTGAIYLLKSLGDGHIDIKARTMWYNYLTQHYFIGKETTSGFASKDTGWIRPPSGGRFIETQYASSAFGIGISLTPLQLASAYASIINGGVYYAPNLRQGYKDILSKDVVSPQVSQTMRSMLETALRFQNPKAYRKGYVMGGKSGTAPTADSNDSYRINADTGTYVGFIGKQKPEYVLLVRLDSPGGTGPASSEAKAVWANISNTMIDKGTIR